MFLNLAINIHLFICFVFCLEDKQQKPPKVLEKFMGGKFKFENIVSIKLLLPLNWQGFHYSVLERNILGLGHKLSNIWERKFRIQKGFSSVWFKSVQLRVSLSSDCILASCFPSLSSEVCHFSFLLCTSFSA